MPKFEGDRVISEDRYQQLMRIEDEYFALQAAGIDNSPAYEEAEWPEEGKVYE